MTEEFVHYLSDGSTLFYTLRRRKGMKNLYIYIRDNALEVRCAPRISFEQIEAFLRDKESWILRQLNTQPPLDPLQGLGKHFPYLGKEYRVELHITPSLEETFHLKVDDPTESAVISSALPPTPEKLWDLYNLFYRENAPRILEPEVAKWSRIMRLFPTRVIYRRNRSRWGSCSSRGTLSLNTRLLLLPRELRDYLIVHELAHLKEMNHSRKFWAIVARHIPDWKARRSTLRRYEHYLR